MFLLTSQPGTLVPLNLRGQSAVGAVRHQREVDFVLTEVTRPGAHPGHVGGKPRYDLQERYSLDSLRQCTSHQSLARAHRLDRTQMRDVM